MVNRERLDLDSIPLDQQENAALMAFLKRINGSYGDRIQKVILFGSKARGDSQLDSDIDLLVLITEDDRVLRRDILRMGARVSLENDVLLNLMVMSTPKWDSHQGFTLYRNVQRDGLPIAG